MIKKKSRYDGIRCITKLRTALFVTGLFFVLCPHLPDYEWKLPDARQLVFIGGEALGATNHTERLDTLFTQARRELSAELGGGFIMPAAEIVCRADTEGIAEKSDSDEELKQAFKEYMRGRRITDTDTAYTIKVNDTLVNVEDAQTAKTVLDKALAKYDTDGEYETELVQDGERQLQVLKPVIKRSGEEEGILDIALPAGAAAVTEDGEWELVNSGSDFDSFYYGLEDIGFSETVEITKGYALPEEISDAETAQDLLTGMQAQKQIYKVESGDTLSVISLKLQMPLDEIIALNDDLENENSIIRIGQELLITVPEPALSVLWTETARCEEVYDLPIEYKYNDSWFTNKKETLREPSAGYREAVNRITRKNDEVINSEVLYEEVGIEAVAKLVEVGTIEPPTYIKPLSGGRISSTFGRRSQPKKGASTYHKGVDIAVPTGTSVWASSGGTVTKAGWAGGYGNVICIQHADGKETRYGHLSKIYVKAGQKVRQGQVIAASGSTGVSTGPHLHFEIRIGGEAVNPLNYVNL